MNCPICGAENAPETKFCVGCGSALSQAAPAPAASTYSEPTPATAPSTDGAKKLPVKAILFGVLGVVAVVLLISLISSLLSGGNGYVEYKGSIRLEAIDEDEYAVIVGTKKLKTTIKSESFPTINRSLDGTAACVITDDGELYVISGKKVKQVKDAEDVQSAIISNNGKGVAYLSMGEDDEFYTLYLAKVSNAKSTKVSEDVVGSYKIAPDGKSVVYFKDGGDDPAELMYSKGKKASKITDDENATVYGLSNGGKQIYVSITNEDGDTNLYSFNAKGKKTKLGSFSRDIQFNEDHTQVLFGNEDGKSYISVKGKEGKKVRNDSLTLVIPSTSQSKGYTQPVSSLYNHVYYAFGEGSVDYYMIKKNKDIKLVGNTEGAILDQSAEYLYFLKDGELSVLKVSKGDKASDKAKLIIDDDFDDLELTSDRKYIYYTSGTELYAVNGKKGGTPREITDELSDDIVLSNKDVLYYIVDGDLYAVSNGKKGKKIQSDVDGIEAAGNLNVYAYGDDKIYGTTGSKKLKMIVEIDADSDD